MSNHRNLCDTSPGPAPEKNKIPDPRFTVWRARVNVLAETSEIWRDKGKRESSGSRERPILSPRPTVESRESHQPVRSDLKLAPSSLLAELKRPVRVSSRLERKGTVFEPPLRHSSPIHQSQQWGTSGERVGNLGDGG